MKDKKMHKTSVGGQALIEGVMMQGPRGIATAVRKTVILQSALRLSVWLPLL